MPKQVVKESSLLNDIKLSHVEKIKHALNILNSRKMMEIISLSSLLKAAKSEGREVQAYLSSSFVYEKNTDVQSYLRYKSIESEQRECAKTTLIIDEKQKNDIVGYFPLMINS